MTPELYQTIATHASVAPPAHAPRHREPIRWTDGARIAFVVVVSSAALIVGAR